RTSSCSGTLIAQNIVLTAAHCVVRPLDGSTLSNFRVYFGTDSTKAPASERIPVTRAVADPAYRLNNFGAGHDAAILVLARAAPANIRPMPFSRRGLPKAAL